MPQTSKNKALPELLLSKQERVLRGVLRAIVLAHPDADRGAETRVATALAILLGRAPPLGAPAKQRDELLEHIAFNFSVARDYEKRSNVSVTEIIRDLLKYYPKLTDGGTIDSVVRDLERKFHANVSELMARHHYEYGNEGMEEVFGAVARIIDELRTAGIAVDSTVVPPALRHGDNAPI